MLQRYAVNVAYPEGRSKIQQQLDDLLQADHLIRIESSKAFRQPLKRNALQLLTHKIASLRQSVLRSRKHRQVIPHQPSSAVYPHGRGGRHHHHQTQQFHVDQIGRQNHSRAVTLLLPSGSWIKRHNPDVAAIDGSRKAQLVLCPLTITLLLYTIYVYITRSKNVYAKPTHLKETAAGEN